MKDKYLPRCAAGEISAFALTEEDVGSDPARLLTNAVKTEDGSGYIVRLYECEGTVAAGEILFGHSVSRLAETNLLEDEVLAEVAVRSGKARVDLRPFEIKTLWVTPA